MPEPRQAIMHIGVTELVGKDEKVDQNDYSASVAYTFPTEGGRSTGEFFAFTFYATETGTGAILSSAGTLFVMSAAGVASGDTAMSAAERQTVIGQFDVLASDWSADATGASAYIHDVPIPFHDLGDVYFVFKLTSATAINSAAGDDEVLEMDAWYYRYS